MSFIVKFVSWYNRMLLNHGFKTNVLSIGPLTGVGDFITQKYLE